MKPTSPYVSLLLSLLFSVAGVTAATASETYSADGVNLGKITESTRFYDTGKGLYWKQTKEQPYRGAQELYQKLGGNFSFLGDLARRVQGTYFVPSAFDELVNDGNSCWYCVGANLLQYWESYYGVFYKGDTPLPYGYTYDSANLQQLGGTQSLDLHMLFYDNWTQEDRSGYAAGGDAEMAVEWFLASGENTKEDKPGYSQLVDGADKAAYFSNYFTGKAASREVYYLDGDKTSLISATDFLFEAFGLDRDGNRKVYGQIAYIGILNDKNQGHAMSCYGFTVRNDGQLESLYLANSDDKNYSVTQVYVGINARGDLHLYEDAAHTKDWTLFSSAWNIGDITYINTPVVLQKMYDEYTSEALTWTGAASTWSSTDAAAATTVELPGKNAAWQVFALDGYYASYYHEGRAVEFNDEATQKNVNLKGALATPSLLLNNTRGAYTFTGTTGATLKADAITKIGSARASFSQVGIQAGTVNVAMGALSLGNKATLTAQTGDVDDFGILELAAGSTATFSKGLLVESTGTLAVTGSAALTTTLTLEADSILHFTLGSANKTTQLLTLTGNLNVLGACELAVDGTLENGQSYILMNVSGSVTNWTDITTDCGNITLSGRQLKLTYKQPEVLTWTGGSGTWTSSLWDGKSSTPSDKKDVFFKHNGSATITVVGTVSPYSMTFTQGTYTLEMGKGGAISACHAVTLGSGVAVTSTLGIPYADINMGSNSRLTLDLPADEIINGLEMAEGAKLTLDGAKHTVLHTGALNGEVHLLNGAHLNIHTSMDTEVYGIFTGDETTELRFSNSSTTQGVTYYSKKDPTEFHGTLIIGAEDESQRTTLRVLTASRNYTINKSGELSLRGNGTFTGVVDGTGTLTIEPNATYQLAPDGQVNISPDISVNVEGYVTAGSAETPLHTGLQDNVTVSGHLTTYYRAVKGGEPLTFHNLKLRDGGQYTLAHLERMVDSKHIIEALEVDGGGSLTNSVQDIEEKEPEPRHFHNIIVNTLSGNGTLELGTSSDVYVTNTTIKDTAPGGYDGDLVIYTPHYYKEQYYPTYDHGQVVELKSGTIKGAVRMEAHGMVDVKQLPYGMAGFGVGGDITIGGIDDTESSKTTYLYSGTYSAAAAKKDPIDNFGMHITPDKHTLTINAAEDYEFHGQVFFWLSLVKKGSGTQTFSGDLTEFEGTLRVDEGELAFTSAIEATQGTTLNGGTLRLQGGGSLSGLHGAASGTGGTLALEDATYDIDLTGTDGKYAVQLNGATVNLTGDTATLPAFGSAITATGQSAINVASGKTLTLQKAITNRGTLALKGIFDASALALSEGGVTHINTDGLTGDSGFTLTRGRNVTVVSGGTTVNAGVTITHSSLKGGEVLTLRTDGKASTGDDAVDYSTYLLTGTDSASVSAINRKAGAQLKSIQVEGGTLTVDAATNLINATGGTLSITQNVTVGGTAQNTAVTAKAGTLNTALSGSSTVTAKGAVIINRANSHTGETKVIDGTLSIGNKDALGTGKVSLTNGTLEIAANGFSNTITSTNTSGITITSGNTLTLQKALANTGTLTLKGAFDASALDLNHGDTTHVDINGKTGNSGFEQSGGYSVTLVNGGKTVDGGANITHSGLKSGTLTLGTDGKATAGGVVDYTSYLLTGTDRASVSAINQKAGGQLTSIDVQGGTLTVDAATNLINATGGNIEITKAVNVGGSISGAKVTASAGTIAATISGSRELVVNKGSRVTLSGSNTYTGGTGVYDEGVLRVTNANALGSGRVLLSCGTLEIAANGVANKLTTSCSGSVVSVENGYTYSLKQAIENSGTVTLKGTYDASALTLTDGETTHVDVNGKTGNSGFTMTTGRSVTIVNGGTTKNGGTTITHSGLRSGEVLTLGTNGKATTGNGVVDYTSYLLTGTDSASVSAITKAAGGKLKSIDMQGGTLVMDAATDKLTLAGGTLDIKKGQTSSASLADTCSIITKNGEGTLTIAQNSTAGSGSITLKEGTLNLDGKDISSKGVNVTGTAALTANGGSVKALTLATEGGADGKNGELLYAEELTLTGNLKTAGLTLTRGNITGGSITASGASTVQQGYIGTGITGTTLTKTGAKRVELGGKNKFTGGVTVQQGALALLEKSSMEANITVNNGASLFTAITVAGDISLQNGAIMRLRPDASYTLGGHALNANAGADFYGDLKTANGSTLTMGLATNTGDAFKVHGDLTIAGGSLGYTGSISQGTLYTLVTATGSITNSSGKSLNALFDLATGTYDIQNTGTAITLRQTAAKSVALKRMTAQAGDPAMLGGEFEAPVTETLAAGVADALVQADWGIVNAQHAFMGTLNGRHQSLRAIGTGRTAVWADAIGSHTRQSSAHGHAGADNTLYGAALGVEFNAGEHGAAGVAIGHTWNSVSTFGMSRVKQDTQHAGVFGRARVFSRGANSLWLEAAAGYGKTESRGTLGYSRERWTQNSGTLTVHANDVMYISENTALNYFGGLEYTATNSGHIADAHTGSVQNLRAEVGAGVTHAIGHGTVFAEAALTGDMVRHNPTAALDMRRRGANPGRIGASITVGGAYAITDHWSVNATYSFEGAKHNNSHNAGIGATLRF